MEEYKMKRIILIIAMIVVATTQMLAFTGWQTGTHDGTPGLEFQRLGTTSNVEVRRSTADAVAMVIPSIVAVEGSNYVITNIANSGFQQYSTMTSISLPNSLLRIGMNAFIYCRGLTSITIPSSVTEITWNVFRGCTAMTNLSVAAGNTAFRSEGNCLIEINGNVLISGFLTSIIPDGVVIIGNSAFMDLHDLTDITIPNSVTTIRSTAFRNTGLTSVTLPSNLNRLETQAFANTPLNSITIPASLTVIEGNPFTGCVDLQNITVEAGNTHFRAEGNCLIRNTQDVLISYIYTSIIPNSVRQFGPRAFTGFRLFNFNIPNHIHTITAEAFDSSGLRTVFIPASVERIFAGAFLNNNVTIYAEAAVRPAGWVADWNQQNRPVVWGHVLGPVPGAVTLSAPVNNATDVSVSQVMTWAAPTGDVFGYKVFIGTTLPILPTNIITDGTSFVSNLQSSTTYQWRVVAFNATGDGESSPTWSFTTSAAVVPGQPTLVSPGHGATNVPLDTALEWTISDEYEVTEFEVFFGTTLPTEPTAIVTENSFSPTLEAGTTYQWRVVAVNENGHGPSSPTRSFTTLTSLPGAVTLLLPANNSTHAPLDQTLVWQVATGDVTGYKVFIGTTLPEEPTATVTTGTSYSPTFFEDNTVYQWRVVAYNSNGDGVSSPTWTFTVGFIVSDEDVVDVPMATGLIGNYPNPFNPSTSIRFTVSNSPLKRGGREADGVFSNSPTSWRGAGVVESGAGSTHVIIEVFNVRGQLVRTLVNDVFPAGEYSVTWNGKDDSGNAVGSGMYMYRMRAGEYTSVKRMVLMK